MHKGNTLGVQAEGVYTGEASGTPLKRDNRLAAGVAPLAPTTKQFLETSATARRRIHHTHLSNFHGGRVNDGPEGMLLLSCRGLTSSAALVRTLTAIVYLEVASAADLFFGASTASSPNAGRF